LKQKTQSEAVKELVYTITDWYDGPRGGVANFEGSPHYYECRWNTSLDTWSEQYLLTALDAETFHLALIILSVNLVIKSEEV
jgi:hypothetical protein